MTIRWTFHGDSISSDSGIMTSNLGTKTSVLMINFVRHEHRGSYTCLATNAAGSAASSAELKIKGQFKLDRGRKEQVTYLEEFVTSHFKLLLISEPPKVVPISFGQDTFDEGTLAQILCTVSAGDEPLLIRWTFHGINISSDSGIMTSNLGTKTSFLIINSVSHSHRGSYTCLAQNKAGSSSSTAKLNING